MALMKKQETAAMRYLNEMDASCLEGGLAFTGMVDGIPIACAGAVEVWNGRYIAWAHISPDAYKHWKSVHRAIKKFLDNLNARRIEAEVEKDFIKGHRWMESLGFICETPDGMQKFFPDGHDAMLFARIGK